MNTLSPLELDWARRIPPAEWGLYRQVMDEAQRRGLRFAVGGGLAFSAWSGQWRNTKDLDLFLPREDRAAMVEVLDQTGLSDYHSLKPYDRGWIYRGVRGDVIVDLIWQMANYRAAVDDGWIARARPVAVDGLEFRLLAPEDLIWAKLYVFQRDRCDWPDLLSVLFQQGPQLDWDGLIDRVGADRQALAALALVFAWIAPGRARGVPERVWRRLGAAPPTPPPDGPEIAWERVRFFDSRPWFGPGPRENVP